MKIDVHTHIIPENIPDLEAKYGERGFIKLDHYKPCCAKMIRDGQVFREIRENCWNPDTRIKESDELGVTIQVLSTIPIMFSYWAKPESAYDLSRYLNDHIAGVVDKYPTRFMGLGTLPMQSPDLAIKEMERCVNELGLQGIEIGTHINEWNLDDPNLFPIFEAAQELDASIFVHPWDMMGKDRMPKYWLPWLVGMPAETSLAICSMIFGGVFERLPRLKVCFAHGGGSFPSTIGRIEHGFKVRPDLCAIDNNINPKKYLGRFWLDSLVHDEMAMKFVIDLIGEDKIVMGSDYPFPLGEHVPGALIDSITDMNDYVKEKLLWKNAIDFLVGGDMSKLRFKVNYE